MLAASQDKGFRHSEVQAYSLKKRPALFPESLTHMQLTAFAVVLDVAVSGLFTTGLYR